MAEIDDLTRLAMFEAWGSKCVWCNEPLFFDEMEVEHLLPRSLKGTEKAAVLSQHGRPADFDLLSLENLAPSCRRCNGGKGRKPPPNAPIIATLLETARTRAPGIREVADKFRSNRQVQRALTIVVESAKSGDEKSLRRLREAADTVALEFSQTAGLSISRLSGALARLAETGRQLNENDPYFYYAAVSHPSRHPGPSLTPGTVMSVVTGDDATTNRIDVVPEDPEALERYGPSFTLTPTDDEAGVRAAELLDKALREGTAVQIGEGLDLTWDRMPPGLSHLVGQTLTGGTVELSQPERIRPVVPDWEAQLTAVTATGRRSVRLVLRQAAEPPDDWDDALVGTFGGMSVVARFRKREGRGEISWTLTHQRDSSPLSEQVAALRFLMALSQGGQLVVTDRAFTGPRPTMTLDVAQGAVAPLTPQRQALVAFFEDLLTIERWTGEAINLPDELPGGEVQKIATVATLIRDGGRSISWSEASFRIPEASVARLKAGGVLRVEQTLSSVVLGTVLQLGLAQIDIPAYEISQVQPVAEEPGYFDVRLTPPGGETADTFERLVKIEQATSLERKKPRRKRKRKHGRQR